MDLCNRLTMCLPVFTKDLRLKGVILSGLYFADLQESADDELGMRENWRNQFRLVNKLNVDVDVESSTISSFYD